MKRGGVPWATRTSVAGLPDSPASDTAATIALVCLPSVTGLVQCFYDFVGGRTGTDTRDSGLKAIF